MTKSELTNVTVSSLSYSPARFTRRGPRAVLVVIDGPDAGEQLALGNDEVVLGSGRECALRITDATVSRRHLIARWTGTGVELRDLDSKNGSFFHDARFQHLECPLGAAFRIGTTSLKVLPEEEVVSPEPSVEPGLGRLVGASRPMRELFALVKDVAQSDVAVLVEGETGTGKELVAEELHRSSGRSEGPFAIFDCGAVPDDLVESSLFGHVRGAFSGAHSNRRGVLEEGDGGSVFLDEIGDLPLDLQPALLRAIDRRMVRPVGGSSYRTLDFRVIAATHRNLAQRISDGLFREDLYYRLAVVRLTVPPLRDRPEDVPLLVQHFLATLGKSGVSIDSGGLARLESYRWPGNVRELRNAVERAVVMTREGPLVLDRFVDAPPSKSGSEPPEQEAPGSFAVEKSQAVAAFERSYLKRLMESHSTIARAAAAAGMDRKHLRLLLRRHALDLREEG